MGCRRYMVDIEDLGKMPGGVILSIGWCRFSPDGLMPAESDEVRLAITPQLDGDTIDWWLQQTALPWAPTTPIVHPTQGLETFSSALAGADEVWAKPPQYDLVGIQSAFKAFGIRQSWAFRAERCFRTLCQTAPLGHRLPTLPSGEKHGALSDAIHQAREAASMLKAMQPR